MSYPTDQELDDLFSSDPETTPTQPEANNTLNSHLPMPMPMPPIPSQASAPVQAASARVSQTAYLSRGCSAASMPDFTREQKRELWNIIQATQRRGSQTTDPHQLIQRFLNNQGASTTHHPAVTTPVPSAPVTVYQHNIPISTQRQPKANPPPAGAKISHARDKNSENRIGQYDWYDEFPTRPNWTARDGYYQVQVKYSKQGELKPIVKFDRKNLEAYVRGCAQQGIPLRLWIQNSATMHTDRFPSRASSMCRAANCPVRNNTIARGMYQVCFDEHPAETSNGRFDPFYVAGYMHLFCLEEMIPMAELMTFADVQPDTRDFPLEQRNPMSLNRDGAGRTLLGAYNEWKSAHYDRYVFSGISIPKATRRSSDCLYKFLTVKKMEAQPSTRQKMRDQRNGFDISKHCGNLRKLLTHKADVKKKRKQARSESEDGSGDADSEVEIILAPRAPAPKRLRTGASNVAAAAAAYPAILSPLCRSRRLSIAQAAQQIEMLSYVPVPPPTDVSYMPYNTGIMAAPSSPPRTARAASMGLNVRTDLTPPVAPGNTLDYPPTSLDLESSSFWDAYNEFVFHDEQTQPQTGMPPLFAYGASPSSPYNLRDTQARRESAVRLLARTSHVNNNVNNINSSLIDPRLLQGPHNHSPKHPSRLRSSNTSAPALIPAVIDLVSPTRRVTRSMSRHPTGATPVEQQHSHAQFEEKQPNTSTPQEDAVVHLTANDDGADIGDSGLAADDLFADIDYEELCEYLRSQDNNEQQAPDDYFDNL